MEVPQTSVESDQQLQQQQQPQPQQQPSQANLPSEVATNPPSAQMPPPPLPDNVTTANSAGDGVAAVEKENGNHVPEDNSPITVEVTEIKYEVTDGVAQIKRKRGRPRKYTFGRAPYLSPVSSTDHSRLSLPSQLTASDVENQLVSKISPELHPRKKPRLGRPPKSSYTTATANVSDSTNALTDKPVVSQHNGQAKKSDDELAANATEQRPPHHELVPNKVRQTPVPFHHHGNALAATKSVPTSAAVLAAASKPITNGHVTNSTSVNGTPVASKEPNGTSSTTSVNPPSSSVDNTNRVAATAAKTVTLNVAATSAKPPAVANAPLPPPPFCNFPFVDGATSILPAPSREHVSAAALLDTQMLRRLYPQAEAAVKTTRAGGYTGPHAWTADMVASFISTLSGCQEVANIFLEHNVDGHSLLLTDISFMMSYLKLKLGPAMKVFGAVVALRQAFMAIPYRDLAVDQAAVLASVINAFPSVQASVGSPDLETVNNRSAAAFSINNLTVEDAFSVASSSSGNGGGGDSNSSSTRVYGNGSAVKQINH